MGVLCTVRMFQLSQPCPTRWARARNSLIRNGPCGHRCSLPVGWGDSVFTSNREASPWR